MQQKNYARKIEEEKQAARLRQQKAKEMEEQKILDEQIKALQNRIDSFVEIDYLV